MRVGRNEKLGLAQPMQASSLVRSCSLSLGPALCLAAAALASCAPPSEDAATSASSDEALTEASLVGTSWTGEATGAFGSLAFERQGARLAYRAERRAPWRIETGVALVANRQLVLQRKNVTERFDLARRAGTLTLRAGATRVELREREPAAVAPIPAPPFWIERAVRAADGLVYGVGRPSPANRDVTQLAAFDEATRAWTELASAPRTSDDPAVVATADGRVYLLGGGDWSITRNVAGAVDTVMAFDPPSKMWLTLPPLPDLRTAAGAGTCPDGRIVVMGGYRSSYLKGQTYYRQPIVYDPRTGQSAYGAEAPTTMLNPAVASDGSGTLYVVVGTCGYGTDASPSCASSSNVVYAYDCRTQAWTFLPPMPTMRAETSAMTDERGRLFVFGGSNGGGNVRRVDYQTVEVFDPTSRTWSTRASDIGGRHPAVVMGPGVFWFTNRPTAFDPNGGAR